MAAIFPALINLSYLQLLSILHTYFLLLIRPFIICSFIYTSFLWWVVWETSQGLFLCTPTILRFVPKATADITPHHMTICSNVTNIVTCPTPDWVVGTSNTSLISFISPCLSISLTVGICLLIFKSSCWCIWRTPWLTSLTCTFLGFVAKPTAGVASQCVTCGRNMSYLITFPTFN